MGGRATGEPQTLGAFPPIVSRTPVRFIQPDFDARCGTGATLAAKLRGRCANPLSCPAPLCHTRHRMSLVIPFIGTRGTCVRRRRSAATADAFRTVSVVNLGIRERTA